MTILSYAPAGFRGHVVNVEVDCRTGIPGMDIVGLPASEVREARDRARVAIRNSGFAFPTSRILVNLSPAHIQKAGNGFDLAIAAAILLASGQLTTPVSGAVMVVGELHLDGRVGPVRGVLAAVAEALGVGAERFIVPAGNAGEATEVAGEAVAAVGHLRELPHAVDPRFRPAGTARQLVATPASGEGSGSRTPVRCDVQVHPGPSAGALTDYRELRGLADLKRLLEVAAAGGHHALVVGPPGAGKSASASLFPTILPALSRDEAIEVTRIHSLASERGWGGGLVSHRPFRAPHHTTSTEGLLGGRAPQIPGEVALAHGGTLFLDEALEFRRPVLQGLREPLEHGRVSVSRAGVKYWFPARIQLLLATNRCPCGMLGRSGRACLCSVNDVDRYWRKLGGPLLDRIDLRIDVPPRPLADLPETDSSAELRERVQAAVSFRRERGQPVRNSDLTAERAYAVCRLDAGARALISRAARTFGLSTRASLSVLRVARTVADLAASDRVEEEHLLEAVSYRRYGEQRPLWQADGPQRAAIG